MVTPPELPNNATPPEGPVRMLVSTAPSRRQQLNYWGRYLLAFVLLLYLPYFFGFIEDIVNRDTWPEAAAWLGWPALLVMLVALQRSGRRIRAHWRYRLSGECLEIGGRAPIRIPLAEVTEAFWLDCHARFLRETPEFVAADAETATLLLLRTTSGSVFLRRDPRLIGGSEFFAGLAAALGARLHAGVVPEALAEANARGAGRPRGGVPLPPFCRSKTATERRMWFAMLIVFSSASCFIVTDFIDQSYPILRPYKEVRIAVEACIRSSRTTRGCDSGSIGIPGTLSRGEPFHVRDGRVRIAMRDGTFVATASLAPDGGVLWHVATDDYRHCRILRRHMNHRPWPIADLRCGPLPESLGEK